MNYIYDTSYYKSRYVWYFDRYYYISRRSHVRAFTKKVWRVSGWRYVSLHLKGLQFFMTIVKVFSILVYCWMFILKVIFKVFFSRHRFFRVSSDKNWKVLGAKKSVFPKTLPLGPSPWNLPLRIQFYHNLVFYNCNMRKRYFQKIAMFNVHVQYCSVCSKTFLKNTAIVYISIYPNKLLDQIRFT